MKWLLFAAMMAGLVTAGSLNAAPVGNLFLQEEDKDADRDGVMSDEKQDEREESKEEEEEEEPDPDLEAAFPSDLAKVGLKKGELMPQIEGKDFEGVKFQLSDYKGKVIMVDFWGDW